VEDLEITEVVTVGIIAALSALLGAAITGAINGIVTYKVTKKQSDVQINMLRENLQHQTNILHENLQHQTNILHENLQHQTNEARRDRIVEARKSLLLEIRESLSRSWGLHASFTRATSVIQTSQDLHTPVDPLVLERPRKDMEALMEEVRHILQLTPQISDTKLKSAVESYMSAFNETIPPVKEAPGISGVKIEDVPTALDTARQHLFIVNQRIEELLVGDDLT